MKRERKILPLILTVVFAFLTALSIVGTFVGDYYQALINSFFDLRSFEIVQGESETSGEDDAVRAWRHNRCRRVALRDRHRRG